MKKQKTKKSLTRRVKITSRGKVLRGVSFKRHLRRNKSKRQIRRLRGVVELKGSYAKKAKKLLGVA